MCIFVNYKVNLQIVGWFYVTSRLRFEKTLRLRYWPKITSGQKTGISKHNKSDNPLTSRRTDGGKMKKKKRRNMIFVPFKISSFRTPLWSFFTFVCTTIYHLDSVGGCLSVMPHREESQWKAARQSQSVSQFVRSKWWLASWGIRLKIFYPAVKEREREKPIVLFLPLDRLRMCMQLATQWYV